MMRKQTTMNRGRVLECVGMKRVDGILKFWAIIRLGAAEFQHHLHSDNEDFKLYDYLEVASVQSKNFYPQIIRSRDYKLQKRDNWFFGADLARKCNKHTEDGYQWLTNEEIQKYCPNINILL
jgi:hypothetical protein